MFHLSYLSVCKELIRTDLFIFKKEFINKCIDLVIWVTLSLGVMAYIMPYFGLSKEFGVFQLGGVIASVALFELYGNVVTLVSDFQGSRIIDYQLTLPIPSWMAIISKVCYYAISYTILAILMIPLGKLVLWEQFDLSQISFVKLALAITFQSMFYACFVLFPASHAKDLSQMRTVWARFIFPMWIMGGFQFSWTALHSALPYAAYIALVNPLIYITEALRVALLGQEGFINFWLCITALTLFSGLFLFLSLRNLKKKLDYI
jgi:ABC-type multidrug transport system permease subunit